MNRSRRKQCSDKFRWSSMEAAKRECWSKWQKGVWIQAYRCRWCGGIHIGHFRKDDLPTVETMMSKTRVYAIFRNGYRESGIHLDRDEAQRELEFLSAPPVLGEKDINEEEYAKIAIDYMEQDEERKAWERQRNRPDDEEWPPRKPGQIRSKRSDEYPDDSMWSHKGWRPSTDVPDGLTKLRRK